MQYDLKKIHTLLNKGFNEQKLRDFCFFEPGFRPVHEQLRDEDRKDKILNWLLDHARRKNLIDNVLAWARTENRAKYDQYQPYAIAEATKSKAEEQIAGLSTPEARYRKRLRERFAEDAPYYIPLAGETTEAVAIPAPEAHAPRSARRRRQRTMAEYHEWLPMGQEIKKVKLKTLREGVDKYPCLILLGDPGAGKTTALEHLAYQFAVEDIDTLSPAPLLPLPLRLSEFRPGLGRLHASGLLGRAGTGGQPGGLSGSGPSFLSPRRAQRNAPRGLQGASPDAAPIY